MEPLRPDDPRELGGYRLLRRVGEGGMGVVYLATSTDGTGADLAAVKAVRPEYAGDREFRARFTVEADLARRVRGPYTARVLDADTDGPRPWLATEYVPGPALHDAVRDAAPFPEDSLLALASGLARALAAIHEVGLVHRDLKPSNVLLSTRGPQVIDFGIARAADATALTRPGQALGTPAYMAPEQATGSGLHTASDLFAFGGVLVFAATGRAPFGSGEPAALLYRVVNEEPDLTGVPERLLPLVTACLAKDPDERPGLDPVLAELTGTALPAGDDDTTEWLPAAVSTTVHHTLVAATRFLPDDGLGAEDSGPEEAGDGGSGSDQAGEAEQVGAERSRSEQAGDEAPSGEVPEPDTGPAEEEHSASEAAAGPVPEVSPEIPSTEAAQAPVEEAPAETTLPEEPDPDAKASAPEPEKPTAEGRRATSPAPAKSPSSTPTRSPARPSAPPRTAAAAPEEDESRSGGTKILWGAGTAALVLVAGLILSPGSDDDSGADDTGVATGGSSVRTDRSSGDEEEEPEPAEIADIAPLSDDRFAVLSNHGAHVYDIDAPEPVEQLPEGPSSDVEPSGDPGIGGPPDYGRDFTYSTLETNADGTVVAAFSVSGRSYQVHVWDLESGDKHTLNPAGGENFERDFALSPDGGTVFASIETDPDRDPLVRAVDTESGEELFSAEVPEYEDGLQARVQGLEVSPDGAALVVALSEGLAVWDAATGEPHPSSPQVREVSRSHNGPMAVGDGFVATAAYEQLRQWDIYSTAPPQSSTVPYEPGSEEGDDNPWITDLSVSHNQERIVGTGHHLSDGLVLVWDRAGELVEQHRTDEYQYSASTAPPSGDGVLLAEHRTGSEPGDIGPYGLRLLDENLETEREYELPAPAPDEGSSD